MEGKQTFGSVISSEPKTSTMGEPWYLPIGHRMWKESRVDRAKVMAWEQMEVSINKDCNEDKEQVVGKEVRQVEEQKVIIRGGESNTEFWK